MVQSFDKQFVAPPATSTKTKFPNRGWFGKMEASSANNLLKQETGRNHDLRYRNSALAARARYIIRKPSGWPCRFIPISTGLGTKASRIVVKASYELSDPSIDSQNITDSNKRWEAGWAAANVRSRPRQTVGLSERRPSSPEKQRYEFMANEHRCHLPRRAVLVPRRFSCMAMAAYQPRKRSS